MEKLKKTVKVVLIEPDGPNGWQRITAEDGTVFFIAPDKFNKISTVLVENATLEFSYTFTKDKNYISFVNKPGEGGKNWKGGGGYKRDYEAELRNDLKRELARTHGMAVLNASDKATQLAVSLGLKTMGELLGAWSAAFTHICPKVTATCLPKTVAGTVKPVTLHTPASQQLKVQAPPVRQPEPVAEVESGGEIPDEEFPF